MKRARAALKGEKDSYERERIVMKGEKDSYEGGK